METTLDLPEGFYIDPESKRTFYVKKTKKMTLVPVWVKSKPAEWKALKKKK